VLWAFAIEGLRNLLAVYGGEVQAAVTEVGYQLRMMERPCCIEAVAEGHVDVPGIRAGYSVATP